jgi:site-specific DNA recombinase
MSGRLLSGPSREANGAGPKRAALYARFSTDRQNERSIDDQFAVCRAYAERQGLTIVATFQDRALSGDSMHKRDGIQNLLRDARSRSFEVVVAETTSRLGRDVEDRAHVRKRLTFAGIEIHTPVDGRVSDLTDNIKAAVDAQQLQDTKTMIRRGLAGVVRDGRNAGGIAYGYRTANRLDGRGNPVLGLREIDPDQGPIVQRIYREYLDERTPREIAKGLNRERIPPPRGRAWNGSTIQGNHIRGNGILRNELYCGRIVWNKIRMVKDPDTGKRVSRPNPESEWQTQDVPELAIIDRDTFERVKERLARRRPEHPWQGRPPKRLLSGLLKCGACGGGMSIANKDRAGKPRIRCSRYLESGTCTSSRTYYAQAIEDAVLATLKEELREPAVIAEYVRTYHEERHRLALTATRDRAGIAHRIATLRAEINRLTDYLVKGIGNAQEIGDRQKAACAEERQLIERLAKEEETAPVVELHPKIRESYIAQIEALGDTLASPEPDRQKAAGQIRALIEAVIVHSERRATANLSVAERPEIEIKGRLAALLGTEHLFASKRKKVRGLLVAEEGLEPPTQGL